MKIFAELAAQVKADWQKKDFSLTAFAEIATQSLQKFTYDLSLEELDAQLKDWALKTSARPAQLSVYNTFGQPSITLFNDGRFVVDLYFWVDFDTSIHSHGFRGAFKVIHGESLQETFRVKLREKISDDLLIVDMSDVKVEKLPEGSVRTIAPGTELTHRVIHLSDPTVSLCVRTVNEPELKQWTYFSNGLAVQRKNLSAELIKNIYVYQYLLGRNAGDEFLKKLIDDLKLFEQLQLYTEVASGALDLRDPAVEEITGAILERHEGEKWWDLFEDTHVNQESPDEIKARALAACATK